MSRTRKGETDDQRRARDRAFYAESRAPRAKAAGHSGYRGQRKARASGAEPGGRRQVHKSAAGTVVQTTARGKGFGVLGRQLRAHPNARVKLRVTYTDDSGRTRDVEVYSKGGRRASDILDAIGDRWDEPDAWADYIESDLDDVYGGSGGVASVGSVQVVIY